MSEAFERDFGAYVVHAWGMTEMSPLGTVCNLLPKHQALPLEQRLRRAGEAGPRRVRRQHEDHRRRRPRAAARRQGVRPPAGARTVGRQRAISATRAARSSTTRATSTPATWRRSTPTATCRSPTAPRTSSSPAANGSPRSTWRTRRWATRGGRGRGDRRRPPEMAGAAAAAGRGQARPDARTRRACCASWRRASPSGGCPTTWCSLTGLPHTATGKLLKTTLREQFRDYRFPDA